MVRELNSHLRKKLIKLPDMVSKSTHTFLLIAATLVLTACAAVSHSPASVIPMTQSKPTAPVNLSKSLDIKFDTGYSRQVKQDSQWVHIGRIEQGDVYKPHQDVFTLEGAHIHEAYWVVKNGLLIGFYLPFEQGFSLLKQPVSVTFQ
jgi:hypothetical protein